MKLTKIVGIHAAQSALMYSPQKITRVWLNTERSDKRLEALLETLSELNVPLEKVDRKKLDKLADGMNHQGVVLEVSLPEELSENELKTAVEHLTETALFLVLDNVKDPHNLGACLRSADATKVHGIIITKDNAVGITPTVCKVASGAAETVPVYVVTNLARTLRWLKGEGLWIIGTAGEAENTLYQTDFTVPMALVIGAEEKGMRRLTREQCDLLVKLPMLGTVESLNLSVATGVLLYETLRQRTV
ncbi:MAG: 23S rRNA (guanosine(2251)-2'-O)-methyltransferase RlmB [Methylococcales bacterium]|nr:23S rRNA (guanosine(2251)-2'-O)-methyltransferase RlmB [Methylococcales bacterium]